jgi:hypothetical protein
MEKKRIKQVIKNLNKEIFRTKPKVKQHQNQQMSQPNQLIMVNRVMKKLMEVTVMKLMEVPVKKLMRIPVKKLMRIPVKLTLRQTNKLKKLSQRKNH